MKKLICLILLIFTQSVNSLDKTCSGHDACRNQEWTGYDNILCRNGERTCVNTKLNCPTNSDCKLKTSGSGHDNYQNSFVFAENANSFVLTCSATGFRGCTNNNIWCPLKENAECKCTNCNSNTKLYCPSGNTCSGGTVVTLNDAFCKGSESNVWCENSNCIIDTCPSGQTKCVSVKSSTNSHLSKTCKCNDNTFEKPKCNSYYGEYTDKSNPNLWVYNNENTGKRPDCPTVSIRHDGKAYHWGTLNKCKIKCLEEPTGLCNIVSRYGESFKSSSDNYHCWFYACPNPNNLTWVTQTFWGNGASSCNTYIINPRHYILPRVTEKIIYTNVTLYINQTRYNNVTRYIDQTRYNNVTRYIDQTRYNNVTRYIDKTRYNNVTRYINKTRYNNITRYIDKTRYNNVTRYIDQTRYNNITRYIDKTRYNNVTRYIDKTRYNNVTRYIDKTRYNNVTRYFNLTKNITRFINKIIYNNITNYTNQIIFIKKEICNNTILNPSIIEDSPPDLNLTNNDFDVTDTNTKNKSSDKTYLTNIEILLICICILIFILFVFRELYHQFLKELCFKNNNNSNFEFELQNYNNKVNKSTQTSDSHLPSEIYPC